MQNWTGRLFFNNDGTLIESELLRYCELNHIQGPKEFAQNVTEFLKIPKIPHTDKILVPLLTSGNPELAFRQILDYGHAYETENGKPFDFDHPHISNFLLIFGRSNFLARWLIRYPLSGIMVLESTHLDETKSFDTMTTELRDLLHSNESYTLTTLKKILRQFKYQEYLRITIRDYAELGSPEDILDELSSVAICCAEAALEASYKIAEYQTEFQLNPKPVRDRSKPLIVLALGKLGGLELNYSSDIDPIIVCAEKSTGMDEDKWKQPYLNRVIRSWIDLLSDVTEDGFIVRVDLRLRPGGNQSPLFRDVFETENYYSTQGALWERQALIKAKAVAGNLEDGKLFLERLSPYIFNKYVDENMRQEIQQMKDRIEKEHLKQHLNVKLGVGGIREVEFFAQIYQLMYGGTNQNLRSSNTLLTVAELQQSGLIKNRAAKNLKESYFFLRKLENCLQMEEEHQVHVIPGDAKKQEILARNMGYWEEDRELARRELLQDVTECMTRVRTIFSSLFDEAHHEIKATLQNHVRFKTISPEMEQMLLASSIQFAAIIKQSTDPRISIRFQRLFETIGAKVEYYEYLLDNPASLHRLSKIAETSEFLWNYLLNHLDLLRQLDAKEVLHTRKDWKKQLSDALDAAEDEEAKLNVLRDFKHSVTFLIGSAELEGILPYGQARKRLTVLAEVILQSSYKMVSEQFQSIYGTPQTEEGPAKFAIIALGKMGGKELTYHSDLDVLFICSGVGETDGPKQISNYQYFAKLIQRLISSLSAFTSAGDAYKVDTRLRPAGDGGPICSTLETYQKYHKTSQPWEHQALIKGRIVGGDKDQEWVDQLKDVMADMVYNWDVPEDLSQKIVHFRNRKEKELSKERGSLKNIKEGFGGLLDVEFLSQYLQLVNGKNIPELRVHRTLEVLELFHEQNVLDQETASILVSSYTFLRLLESYLRLHCDSDTNMIDLDDVQSDKIIGLLHKHGFVVEDIQTAYKETTERVRAIFSKHMV